MSSKALTAIVERLKERHKAGDPDVVQPKRVRKPKAKTATVVKLDASVPKKRTLH